MAFSSSLKPTGKNLLTRIVNVVSPTGIGVLLSIGAHAAFIAFGPRANFSFAALSEAAQQQDAEETIVPVVQLTEAERSRLPSFAQPRRLPPSPTGLGSLSLPSGLPSISNNRIVRTPTAARPLPSPTLRRPRQIPSLRTTLNPSISRPRQPVNRVTQRPAISVPIITTPPPPRRTATLPSVDSSTLPNLETRPVPNGDSLEGVTPAGRDNDNGSAADLQQTEPNISVSDILARGQNENDAQPNQNASQPSDSGDAETTNNGEARPIPVEPVDIIATAPAQGNAAQLLDGFTYSALGVNDDYAQTKREEWLSETAAGKDTIDRAEAELTIDSNFKVCKDIPPARGLIGVVVNPDGSKEAAEVLSSTGYDILNRQALDAVAYNDFGQPTAPTQYEVSIDVTYNPQGCVNELPENQSPVGE